MREILCHIPRIEPPVAASYSMLLQGLAGPQPNVTLTAGAETSGTTADLLRRLTARRVPTDRYVTREVIDEGGMGVIQKIWDDDLQRHLVRKFPKIRPGADPWKCTWQLSRFLQEAQITSQLNHPGILPVHDLGLDADGTAFYTMPLITGETLDRVFAAHAAGDPEWTLTRCLNVLIKVLEALAFAHSLGVVHRDIKPGNVMVGRFGETYVMDWGLSRVLGQPDLHNSRIASAVRSNRAAERHSSPSSPLFTWDGQVIGTPAYMAPEQATGKIDEIGPRTDIYAVGAILYQLLSGKAPYESMCPTPTAHTILSLVREGPPEGLAELSPDTPRALAAICAKAMAREPRDRYANARTMARQIEAFRDDRPTEDASGWEILRLAVRRNWALLSTAAAAVIVIVLGLVAVILFRDAESTRRQRIDDALWASVLVERSEANYPIHPDNVPRMDTWLTRARELLSRRPGYAAEARQGLVTDPPYGPERERMLEHMATIAGIVPVLERHRSLALDLRKRSIEAYRDAWDRACEAIAKSPVYRRRVHLQRQLGLVPLRADPVTGYWEFWMPLTGEPPGFDPEKPGYRLTPESSIVLVLLPGGEFWIGSRPEEHPTSGEMPRRERLIAPFFIGKYEVQQAVWERIMASNPSLYRSGTKITGCAEEYTPLHPVDSISWQDAYRFAHRIGLRLPSETQWEYACRAGSSTAYSNGNDPVSGLRDRENVRDLSAIPDPSKPGNAAPWNDGFRRSAPIGRFLPNCFGLHDMQGNLAEWTSDPWTPMHALEAPASVSPDSDTLCVVRGGHYYQVPAYCRAGFRSPQNTTAQHSVIGLRVARTLD